MITGGAPAAAITLLQHVLSCSAAKNITVCAWNNIGTAYTYLDRMTDAHKCHAKACSVDEDRPEPWLNRLIIGVQLGFTVDARDVCRVVDSFAPSAEDLLRRYAESKRIEREKGEWCPSEASRKSLDVLQSTCGSAARRVLSVFD